MAKLLTPKFRVSFPALFEKRGYGNAEPKYSCVMLFDIEELEKDKAEWGRYQALRTAAQQAAIEKWGSKLPKNIHNPFRWGEEKDHLEGYDENTVFITATSKNKPGVCDHKVQDIIDTEEVYAGCYARATVNTFTWTNGGKNGVSFGLQNLQKLDDGEPFSGKSNAEDDFDAVSEEGDFDEDKSTDGMPDDIDGLFK